MFVRKKKIFGHNKVFFVSHSISRLTAEHHFNLTQFRSPSDDNVFSVNSHQSRPPTPGRRRRGSYDPTSSSTSIGVSGRGVARKRSSDVSQRSAPPDLAPKAHIEVETVPASAVTKHQHQHVNVAVSSAHCNLRQPYSTSSSPFRRLQRQDAITSTASSAVLVEPRSASATSYFVEPNVAAGDGEERRQRIVDFGSSSQESDGSWSFNAGRDSVIIDLL